MSYINVNQLSTPERVERRDVFGALQDAFRNLMGQKLRLADGGNVHGEEADAIEAAIGRVLGEFDAERRLRFRVARDEPVSRGIVKSCWELDGTLVTEQQAHEYLATLPDRGVR